MLRKIAILRPGLKTAANGASLNVTPEVMQSMVAGYDFAAAPAPVVFGHPVHDSKAMGWVQSLAIENDMLMAHVDLSAEAEEAIAAKSYRRISSSIFAGDHPSNPTPGSYALRHVGLLGAVAPSDPGLPVINFAADDAAVMVFDFEVAVDAALPGVDVVAALAAAQAETAQLKAEVQSLTRGQEEARADLAAAQARAAAQATADLAAADAAALDALISDGRIAPADKSGALNFMAAIAGTLDFAARDGAVTARDWFLKFAAARPRVIDLSELSGDPAPLALSAADVGRAARTMVQAAAARGESLDIAIAVDRIRKGGK
jgi:hypothetical protein